MRYTKPIAMDLNARMVAGQVDPLSCYSGDEPGGYMYCDVGTGGGQFANPCATGHGALGDPGNPVVCLAGGAASWCDAGAGGTEPDDDCTVGPSNV